MDELRIQGGMPLKGSLHISGAKNAALPLLCCSLLTDHPLTLSNIPFLTDTTTLIQLLSTMGVECTLHTHAYHDFPYGQTMEFKTPEVRSTTAPYDLVRKMRASILVLGPLLSRYGHAKVSLPGGCAIGTRPVDLHLKGMEQLGAHIDLVDGYVVASAPQGLKGACITFPLISVGATENVLMASVLAKGTTVLNNAAIEPEITDLALCLNAMGAKIQGIGTHRLEIEGVCSLRPAVHRVVPDRIELGTYAMAAIMTGGDLELIEGRLDLLPYVVDILRSVGGGIEETSRGLRVWRQEKILKPHNIATREFPFFPTDLQAQYMAMMLTAQGSCTIEENIFENRFMQVPELCRLGADIRVQGGKATIYGGMPLKGAPVMATDLRASFSLVMAALVAQGETTINHLYHLDRGYEQVEKKLGACGALIQRIRQ
jgi:UDP-N-acetylglucosamine 1-carboxyvinyltransferase